MAVSSGDYEDAAGHIMKALGLDSKDESALKVRTQVTDALAGSALEKCRQKDYSEATRLLAVVREFNPEAASVRKLPESLVSEITVQAKAALDNNEYNEAIRIAQNAFAIKPDDSGAQVIISQAQEKTEQFAKLLESAREMLDTARYEEAANLGRQALEIRPADAGAHDIVKAAEEAKRATDRLTLARKALEEKRYEDAAAIAREMLEAQPEDEDAKAILQAVETAENRFAELLASAQNALARKDYDGAAKKAQEALELMPGDAKAQEIAGKAGKTLQKLAKLLAEAEKALDEKLYSEALKKAQEALKIKPGDKRVIEIIARCREATRVINGKIIAIQPGNIMLLNVGSDNGVKKGDIFIVQRVGRTIGKIEIFEVEERESRAIVLENTVPIKMNDYVTRSTPEDK
jgi:tetratricopeptide (TPR) repeat protein